MLDYRRFGAPDPVGFELAAAGLPVEHDYSPIPVDGRRSIRADIVIPALRLVVEYDGSYYHARKAQADRKQTASLESVGWTVLRVREEPLPALGGHEIFVGPTEPMKSVTIKALDTLATIGIHAMHKEEYIRDPNEWGKSQANEALYRTAPRVSPANSLPLQKSSIPRRTMESGQKRFIPEVRPSFFGRAPNALTNGIHRCGSAQPATDVRVALTTGERRNGQHRRRANHSVTCFRKCRRSGTPHSTAR